MNHSAPVRSLLLAALLTLAGPPHASRAQPTALTIDSVVAKLQANLDSYQQSIPSLIADEHIDSTVQQFRSRGSAAGNYETIAESVFRLKRTDDPKTNTFSLDESRDVRIIDGKPAKGRDIDAPAMVFGAFSGGLAFVSQDESPCMTYQLEKIRPRRPIVVQYESAPNIAHPEDCILTEPGSGRVTIDPATMQITRIEVHVPRHTLVPTFSDGQKGAPTITRWTVEVNYRPVTLNSRTFWLPATIVSLCSNDDTEWSFHATYRNYRLLEVHSRLIIPHE